MQVPPTPWQPPDIKGLEDYHGLCAEVPELRELSEPEQRAVIYYAFSGNKSESVKAGGYGRNRRESAAQQGWLFFARPTIQVALRALNAFLARSLQDEVAALMRQIMLDASYDPSLAFDETTGAPLPLHQIPAELRQRIQSYRMGRYGPEIVFVDKSRAREFLLDLLLSSQSSAGGMSVTINLGEPTDASAPRPERLTAGQFVLDMTDKVDAQTLQPPIGKADATTRQPPTNGKADGP